MHPAAQTQDAGSAVLENPSSCTTLKLCSRVSFASVSMTYVYTPPSVKYRSSQRYIHSPHLVYYVVPFKESNPSYTWIQMNIHLKMRARYH